jgi:CxxC motif-containing protein (DUF1111 family)
MPVAAAAVGRLARTAALLLSAAMLSSCARGTAIRELLEESSGGAMTAHDTSRKAFARAAPNLEVQARGQFSIGNAFFNSSWVVAPATAGARDGLGPLFNARSCDACHNNDGRGLPPLRADERPISLVIQFATDAPGSHGEPQPDPRYGGNLNPFAIGGVPAEGSVAIAHREQHGTFADGAAFTLLEPRYSFTELAYGELAPTTRFSPRVAPAVFGVGLLEVAPEAQILARHDPEDANRDGISGRVNRVPDQRTGQLVLGRFGWKANQPDIAHQTAAAFSGEIGMSSQLRPGQNCSPLQAQCAAAPDGGIPEISEEIFTRIVNYQRMLAVPARRALDDPDTRRGARQFAQLGCETCHRATFTTTVVADAPWLSQQTFHPFTDLLLHDMGPGLADQRADFAASGSEWRTAPLWGLGLQSTVNGHTRLMHDGRARDVSEAILWHGGEAQRAKEGFQQLSAAERSALLAFLNSL